MKKVLLGVLLFPVWLSLTYFMVYFIMFQLSGNTDGSIKWALENIVFIMLMTVYPYIQTFRVKDIDSGIKFRGLVYSFILTLILYVVYAYWIYREVIASALGDNPTVMDLLRISQEPTTGMILFDYGKFIVTICLAVLAGYIFNKVVFIKK